MTRAAEIGTRAGGGEGAVGGQQQPVNSPPPDEKPKPPPHSLLARLLPFWLVLAAVGQTAYLGHWPLYLVGVPVPYLASLLLALVRLGVYAGLAWGLVAEERSAWAGTVLELWRTFLLMGLQFLLHRWTPSGLFYPAGWTQGAVSGILPLVVGLNVGVAKGWRPGGEIDYFLFAVMQVLTAASALGALALSREGARFGVPAGEGWAVLLRRGLPFVLVLSAAEGAAYLLGWSGGR